MRRRFFHHPRDRYNAARSTARNPFPGAQPVQPLAHSLENFDPLGRWRTHDQSGAVDASGAFVDGTIYTTPGEFRKGLLRHPDAFRTTITERLFRFAADEPVKAIQGTPDTLAASRHILEG